MAKYTRIQIWSKERDEHGFPKKRSEYDVGFTIIDVSISNGI
jgi:hypothetical protein